MAPARWLGDAQEPAAAGDAVQLVRPLLEVGHEELVGWLQARGQAFREDESNLDRRFLRNRVRHEVIPFLREHLSPSIVKVLARNAEIAASDAELLEGLARQAFGRLAAIGDGTVEIDCERLLREPDAVRRRVVLLALGNLRGVRFVGREQVARVLALAAGLVKGPLAVPGATAAVLGTRLVLVRSAASERSFSSGMNFSSCALSTPGEARLAGLVVSSFVCSWNGSTDAGRLCAPGAGTVEAVVDASRAWGLSVRTRRPGDWFRPLGLVGRKKKLQDYFVDRKVPREARDRVPLVVDHRDRIVWVAGHGIDEEFRVRDGTRDVVILKLRGESA